VDLVVVAQITLSLLALAACIYAAAVARAAVRERAGLARMLDRMSPASPHSPAQRLDVAELLLRHAEATLAEAPPPHTATEDREAVLFGLRWADQALTDAELLASEEQARLAAARTRLRELRTEVEEMPPASTRRCRR